MFFFFPLNSKNKRVKLLKYRKKKYLRNWMNFPHVLIQKKKKKERSLISEYGTKEIRTLESHQRLHITWTGHLDILFAD